MNTSYKISREYGFTLVELMISMVLGLFVVGMVLATFLIGTRNYSQNDRFARMQDNGRYALKLLTAELSNAGYWGGMTSSMSITASIDDGGTPVAADCGVGYDANVSLFLLSKSTPSAAKAAYSCIDDANFKSGTDVLLVQRVASEPTPPAKFAADPTYQNQAYLKTNLSSASFVKVSGGSAPGDMSASTIPGESMTYWRYQPRVYYVRNDATTGTPGLYRKYLASDLTMQDEVVAEGVENVRILFGIDTDTKNDGVVNQYIANPTAAQIEAAINARIYVLVRSSDKDRTYADSKTYWLGDTCYNIGGTDGCAALTDAASPSEPEKYHRRVLSTTVMLRNPLYQMQF
jgi:type IV pilus assembly protein PilW